jgi:hypothetical protein
MLGSLVADYASRHSELEDVAMLASNENTLAMPWCLIKVYDLFVYAYLKSIPALTETLPTDSLLIISITTYRSPVQNNRD